MARAESNEREGRAVAKYLRISPQKARRAADLVRDQQLLEARRRLAFTPIRGARVLSKVLESAVANGTHNFDLPEDRLYIHRVFVDEGMTIKRWIPRAYGRANKIRRRTSHITVVVRARLEDAPQSRPRRKAGAGRRKSSAATAGSAEGRPSKGNG
jgi:large subunit ribosomal protein L22